MSSVIFASPLKAASPIAQSVYDPAAVARPILKKDASLPVLLENSAFVHPVAPHARPSSKPVKNHAPLPARADPRFNPVKIAKSEASLNTRIFLQTKPHAGDAVVGAQRFLALNRGSELRQFKRQLADTAPVAVAIGPSESRPFEDYLRNEQDFQGIIDDCANDEMDGIDASLHGAVANDDDVEHQVDESSDDDPLEHDAEEAWDSNGEDGEIDAILAASVDAVEEVQQISRRSHSASSETDSLASRHEPVTDFNIDSVEPFAAASPPDISATPARVARGASPLPAKHVDVSGGSDLQKSTPTTYSALQKTTPTTYSALQKTTPTTYSALHAARISPPVTMNPTVTVNPSSNTKAAPRVQAFDEGASGAAGKALRPAVTIAPPASFAGLSKYSQQMVIELTNTQQSEAQSSAKIAQRDLLKLRDAFQKVSSAEYSVRQVSKSSSARLAAKSQPSPSIRNSKQASHLNEPTPPRSKRPVPNSVVSKAVPASNVGVYDIDDADDSTPVSHNTFATVTPRQHRPSSLLLPSVSPFFQTPERPDILASQHNYTSTRSPVSAAFHIPLPVVDSVPCTPRPSTPPQPIQNQSSVEHEFSSLIPRHNEMMPVPENFKFSDLEAPQVPPYPDLFIDRNSHDIPSLATIARVELPHFQLLFESTDDREHDVFAAISALSAPLESLVAPQSRLDPRVWLSVIDTDADIGVRIQRLRAAHLAMTSLLQKDESEVKTSFKRLNELRVDLLWQTKRRQLRFWLNSSGHVVLGPRKKEFVMRFLGLTPASKHAKSISIKEPPPGCAGVAVEKRWQGSDFKIQLMMSLVSKYQLHLAFVQFRMNAASARATRHVSACISLANSRRYILLGWSCFSTWHTSRLRTREVAMRSGSNKWYFFLQMVLRSWSRFVASRIKRQRSLAHFQHSVDLHSTSKYFKRWSSSVRVRKHGNVLASAACQFWYLTCSLRCILRWWQSTQALVSRKHALRAFAGSNSGSVVVEQSSNDGTLKSRSLFSKVELEEHMQLKHSLAVRRRKQLLAPLKILLQQKKVALSALNPQSCARDPPARKTEPSTSDVAISAATRRLLSRTFCIWKELSNMSTRAKTLTLDIELRCKKRTFVFWKYIVALHRGFSSLAIRMQISCSKRALSLWQTRACLEKRCLHSISNRCRLRLLHSIISSWKIVGCIDALASDWRLKRHFAMWQRALPIIWLDRDREGSRLNRLRATGSAFGRWRSCVQRNKRLLALLLRGQLLYCKHLLVVVWTSWRLVTASASLRSGTIKRLFARRSMRCLGGAFACWVSHLSNVRLLRRVFRAAAERWHLALTLNSESVRSDMNLMADYFCAWQVDAKVMKQERLLKSIYATAVVYQSIRCRRTILHSWSRWAYCKCTSRKQFERSRQAYLRSVVSSWASLAVVTKALLRRVEVRQRRKRLEGCVVSMRAAVHFGKCRRGPVSRRYFRTLKWYCQTFCWELPQQHRRVVVQRRAIQAWSMQRLMSLKVAVCVVTTSRFLLKRSFNAWTVHTGDRKRSIISHRLANAHATYCTKKRVFCALKQRLADAALHFFLLGKAVIFNSRRCLNEWFQRWKAAAAAEREQRLAPHPSSQLTAVNALPVVTEAPHRVALGAAVLQLTPVNTIAGSVEQASEALLSQSAADALPSVARAEASSEAGIQSFRAIPVTVTQSSAGPTSGLLPKTSKTQVSRQRLFSENVAPRRVPAQLPAGKVAEVSRATHGTQTSAPSKSKRPPLLVEQVPQRPVADARVQGVVVGRPVVSSFLLSDLRTRAAALSPSESPRESSFK